MAGLDGFYALAGDSQRGDEMLQILHGEVVSCGTACTYQALHGIALEESGRPVEAIEQYEAYLTHGPLTWHTYLTAWRPTVLERLAGLYEAQGDTDEARATLQRIVDQYSEGDGPFVAYVQRARQKLASLGE